MKRKVTLKDDTEAEVIINIIGKNGGIDLLLHDLKHRQLGCLYSQSKVNKEGDWYLYLQDIHTSSINKGYGSILLSILLEEIKNNKEFENIKYIYGGLSSIDMDDHKDRLIHFYQKNNYTIKLYDKPSVKNHDGISYGEIKLEIDRS